MRPRAVWKGFLKLERIACAIEIYKATTEADDKRWTYLNSATGNRIKQPKVDAVTGELVESDDIVRAVEVGPGKHVVVTDEEIAAAAPASNRLITISRFVAPKAIPPLHFSDFYFLGPQGDAAEEAFAAIRIALEKEKAVALAQVTMGTHEHLTALMPCGKGMTLALLRYAHEVRDAGDCFERLGEIKPAAEVIEGTRAVVDAMTGEFAPADYHDKYAANLDKLKLDKIAGRMLKPPVEPKAPAMTSLADAVEKSVESARKRAAR